LGVVRRLVPVLLAVAAALAATLTTSAASAPPAAAQAPPYRSTISFVTAGDLPSSWRPGCPVGPAQLRRVTLSHWGFDGAVHTGVLIVHADVAGQVVDAFGDLFRRRFAIERIRPVDAYGGSDDASMADNNTSAFNCRAVTGGTSWSWHAYGRAIDINPVQNPYVRGGTILPPAGAAHLDRSPGQGRLVPGEGTVEAFTSRGWTWGGTWTSPRDYQHVERRSGPGTPVPVDGGAAVASPGSGVLHVAQRTGTGEVALHTRSGGSWSTTNLGGGSDSTPDVAVSGSRVDVVILGRDGAAWHRRRTGGTWSAWTRLGGGFLSGPSIVATTGGRLDVFGRGQDGALWTATSPSGGAFGAWRSLGGAITSDPDAATWGGGRIDVVARGGDGAIWQRAFVGGSWRPWASFGGASSSGPGIASRGTGRLDVVTRGTDGATYARSYDGAGWTGWYGLGGTLGSDPDAAAEPGGGPLHVVAAGGDGTSVWARALAGTWGPWVRWFTG
jgi:hypothetical protein